MTRKSRHARHVPPHPIYTVFRAGAAGIHSASLCLALHILRWPGERMSLDARGYEICAPQKSGAGKVGRNLHRRVDTRQGANDVHALRTSEQAASVVAPCNASQGAQGRKEARRKDPRPSCQFMRLQCRTCSSAESQGGKLLSPSPCDPCPHIWRLGEGAGRARHCSRQSLFVDGARMTLFSSPYANHLLSFERAREGRPRAEGRG